VGTPASVWVDTRYKNLEEILPLEVSMAGPFKYDPTAYFYIEAVEAYLNRPGHAGVSLDLFDRLAAVGAKAKKEDNSIETTKRRISWCCHIISDALLEQMELAKAHLVPPPLRPQVTETTFNAMEQAFVAIEQAADVDHAEFKMGEEEAQRKAAQLWDEKVQKMKRLLLPARRLLVSAREYMRDGEWSDGATVGERLLEFLLALDKPRDDLVTIAESLVGVRA
jgi:hypothetical protein